MRRSVFYSLLISACGVAALAVALIATIINDNTTTMTPESRPYTSAKVGGDFTLINMSGDIVSQNDYAGKYLLIYFGFSYCPDVCPTALLRLSDALEIFEREQPAAARKITPIFISVDYERDTPEALKNYTRHFHPRLEGLTGDAKQIKQVKSAYKIYSQKVRDSSLLSAPPDGTQPDDYTIDHSSIIYLMDKQNNLLAFFTDDKSTEEIIEKLKIHIN